MWTALPYWTGIHLCTSNHLTAKENQSVTRTIEYGPIAGHRLHVMYDSGVSMITYGKCHFPSQTKGRDCEIGSYDENIQSIICYWSEVLQVHRYALVSM